MTDSMFSEEQVQITHTSIEETVGANRRASLSGQVIDKHYRVEALIGEGAWSTVYRGWHLRLNKQVAIKFLNPGLAMSSDRLKRFELEAQVVGKLNHGNIVKVYDFGNLNDKQPYMVLDLVEGSSLESTLKTEKSLSLERTATIGKQLAQALEYAHLHDVVHRDIKPANILLESGANGKETCRLVDFGLVKVFRQENETQLTQTGETVGTPQYMSPEQCRSEAVDGRTDIYALGCVLYECLAGAPAFDGRNAFECMRSHFDDTPKVLFDRPNEQERAVQDVIFACLEKQPSARPTAPEVVRLLNLIVARKYSQANKLTTAIVARTKPKRKLGHAGMAAIAGLIAVASAAGIFFEISTGKQIGAPKAATNLPPQQGINSGFRSSTDVLKSIFNDIEYNIQEMKTAGQASTAEKFQAELKACQLRFASTNGITNDLPDKAVHVISIEQGSSNPSGTAEAAVVVSAKEKPLSLALRARDATKWSVTIRPGTKLTDIYLIGPQGKDQTLAAKLTGVRIHNVAQASLPRLTASPDSPDAMSLVEEIENVTQSKVATYQGQYDSKPNPWVVGPESEDWRAQIVLNEIARLHESATKFSRDRVVQYLKQNRCRITVQNAADGTMRTAQLSPPKSTFDYLPGRRQGFPQDECSVSLVNWSAEVSVPEGTQPKLLPMGTSTIAVDAVGLIEIDKFGRQQQLVPSDGLEFNPEGYDFTYDPISDKIFVRSSSSMFVVDPKTKQWSRIRSIEHKIKVGKASERLPAFVQGMSIDHPSGSGKGRICFLEAPEFDIPLAQWLTQYSLNKRRLEQLPLNYRIPLSSFSQGEGREFTPMTSADGFLLVVAGPPAELAVSGKHGKFLWVLNAIDGRVLLTAPISDTIRQEPGER